MRNPLTSTTTRSLIESCALVMSWLFSKHAADLGSNVADFIHHRTAGSATIGWTIAAEPLSRNVRSSAYYPAKVANLCRNQRNYRFKPAICRMLLWAVLATNLPRPSALSPSRQREIAE
jgi:hypothetical protein